jgi:hypothetical protein
MPQSLAPQGFSCNSGIKISVLVMSGFGGAKLEENWFNCDRNEIKIRVQKGRLSAEKSWDQGFKIRVRA